MYLNKNTNEVIYSPKEIVVGGIRYPKQVFDNLIILNNLDIFELIEEPIPNGRLYTYIEEVDAVNLVLKRTPIARSEAELLAVAKEDKLAQIETDYIATISADIPYKGSIFQADKVSTDLIAQNLSVGSVPEGFYWKALDNSKIPMIFTDLQGLASAIQQRGLVAFSIRSDKKESLLLATTIGEVEII